MALRAALKLANVPDDAADRAAEEVAGFENRLAKIEADLTLLRWMVSVNVALTAVAGAPAVWLLIRVAAKVGALP
jgi:hypothetical protein